MIIIFVLFYNASNFLSPSSFGITKNEECPWTSLKGTILDPPRYPDSSQVSGVWTLGGHLPIIKGSSSLLEISKLRSKINIDYFPGCFSPGEGKDIK